MISRSSRTLNHLWSRKSTIVRQKTSTHRPSSELSIKLGQPYRIEAGTGQNGHWRAILDIPGIQSRIWCRFMKTSQRKSAADPGNMRAQADFAPARRATKGHSWRRWNFEGMRLVTGPELYRDALKCCRMNLICSGGEVRDFAPSGSSKHLVPGGLFTPALRRSGARVASQFRLVDTGFTSTCRRIDV